MRAETKTEHTDDIKKKKRKTASAFDWRFPFFTGSGIYLECVFHWAVYHTVTDLLYPMLAGACFGMILAVLTLWLPPIGNKIISYMGLSIGCIYTMVQLIYYRIFGTFLSLISVGGAGNAMDFKSVMFEKIRENLGWLFGLLLPLLGLLLLQFAKIRFEKTSLRFRLLGMGGTVFWIVVSILLLNAAGRDQYSPYQLFHNQYVLELSMNKLGVGVTTIRDAQNLLFGQKQSVVFTLEDAGTEDGACETVATASDGMTAVLSTESDAVRSYEKQVDAAIDFKKLYQESADESVKNVAAYCLQKTPTLKNEYTGMFDGYNVVFVTAESLCRYGVYEACTPTLYKIMKEGFVFENFYNPLWYHSTIDGEYVNCIGQYPSASEWSFYKSAETYQPYALGNALKEKGYISKAYHDFDFYYYNRSETHENMGYDFKAVDYGLEIPYYATYSDYDTIEAVYEEFSETEPFLMYFMTFSGHLPYNYEYNAMCVKNREEAEEKTKDMDLPEDAVAYIAAQMELDKALEDLMQKLEADGKLEQTVFIVTPDHYPYGLSDEGYDALAGKPVSKDTFEKHRSYLGIWSASMENPIRVDKLCSSVDVLPTVLNLLGVTYDSRMLAGNDSLSDSEQLVIFADHSFKTDKVAYNTKTGEITYYVDEKQVPQSYLEEMMALVETKLYMSDLIIDTNFYEVVETMQ